MIDFKTEDMWKKEEDLLGSNDEENEVAEYRDLS